MTVGSYDYSITLHPETRVMHLIVGHREDPLDINCYPLHATEAEELACLIRDAALALRRELEEKCSRS